MFNAKVFNSQQFNGRDSTPTYEGISSLSVLKEIGSDSVLLTDTYPASSTVVVTRTLDCISEYLDIYTSDVLCLVHRQLSVDTEPASIFDTNPSLEVKRSVLVDTDYVAPIYVGSGLVSRSLDFSAVCEIAFPEYIGQQGSFVPHIFDSHADYVSPTYEANCLVVRSLALGSSGLWVEPVYAIEIVQREVFRKGSSIHQVFVI